MGPNSNTKSPETHSLDAQMSWEEEMLHHGKHAPRPNYYETCSRHQIWNVLILCIQF